jgi:hypothetical protein
MSSASIILDSDKTQNVLDEAKSVRFKKWEHFHEDKRSKKIKCKYCDAIFSTKSSSSTLSRHYSNFHQKPSNQSDIKKLFQQNKSEVELNPQEELISFIVEGQHTFDIVQEPKFIKFCRSLNKDYILPSRFTVKRNIMKKHKEMTEKVITFLYENTQKIAVTTDMWTSNSQKPFMAITGHFFDYNFVKRNILIDFSMVPYPHTGKQICEKLLEIFDKFNIRDKIISITTDNATNNVSAMNMLKLNFQAENFFKFKSFHLRCFAYVLNLIVENGLKKSPLNKLIEKIRNLVTFVKTSPKEQQKFELTSKTLGKVYFSLKKDVKNRWNSVLIMLNSVISMDETIKYLCFSDVSFKEFSLNNNEWETLKEIQSLLRPFEEATNAISGQKYASICLLLPIFQSIELHIKTCEPSNSEDISSCAKIMLKKLDKYKTLMINDITEFAVVVDPRLKFDYFEDSTSDMKTKFTNFFNQFYALPAESAIEEPSTSFITSIYKKRKTDSSNEIEKYINFPTEGHESDPALWWKNNISHFPNLSKLAFDILLIPASSVPCEQIFSKSGELITKKRNCLNDSTVMSCMCLGSWIPLFETL